MQVESAREQALRNAQTRLLRLRIAAAASTRMHMCMLLLLLLTTRRIVLLAERRGVKRGEHA